MTGNVTLAWSVYSKHGKAVTCTKSIKVDIDMIPAKTNFRALYIIDKPEGLLNRLIRLLVINGVSVKIEHLENAPGKFCMLNSRLTLVMDANVSQLEQAEICARAFAAVEDTDSIYLKPDLRDFIARHPVNLEFTKSCRQWGIKG